MSVLLDLAAHTVETARGPRKLLVATPTSRVVAGQDKLEQLRATLDTSNLDLQIVEHIESVRPDTYRAFLFRGRGERGGTWTLSPDLSPTETIELCDLMYRAQLPLNRFCASRGIFANFYTDWPEIELTHFAGATNRIAEAIRGAGRLYPSPDTPEARLRRLNLWLLERHTFLHSLPLDTALRSVLPRRFERLEDRRAELDKLLRGLPQQALDGRRQVEAY